MEFAVRIFYRAVGVAIAAFLSASVVAAQVKESTVVKELDAEDAMTDAQRPAATIKVAQDIANLPAGPTKVKDADRLARLVTEGDEGEDALQAAGNALAKALRESPVSAKGDDPPMPYLDLARLVHYEGVTTTLTDPRFAKAEQILTDHDADIQKIDFTLKDLHNHPVTLSALRGKVVLINFWATWCGPCRLELPILDFLSTRFESQGLVILCISDEDRFTLGRFLAPMNFHPEVLLDPESKVHKQFHLDAIPQTYVFDRNGNLVGVGIDRRSARQFLTMLSRTDLHP